ncbi:probable thiopurine S-methyltransferase isoform X2 [Ruditapes philippinarum]|uniref:probable thiopurine S-methyltransferase isoform X2 n=1 Tax=Ruditapes philippinarum TaxID=129788 RepID=UPI00295B9503|nr:probable thiopurine S-methyltransferase isoform X2 [Ruditapes philippinarum]
MSTTVIMEGKQKLNQFGDFTDVSNMTVDDWDYRWSLDQTKFHMPIVHPMLKKHIQKLTLGRNRQTVFVPLCGKSLDMKWLLEEGHEVVGNECVDSACKQFFEENKIPYTTEKLGDVDGVLYKATDGKSIKIYRCDCFDLTSKLCGKFDCIWDRGGFVALPVKDRKRYANVMKSLMKPDCRYMLDCFLVDNEAFAGPPFNCTTKDVSKCFDQYCGIQKIDIHDAFTKWQESWGIKSFVEEVYMLKPK